MFSEKLSLQNEAVNYYDFDLAIAFVISATYTYAKSTKFFFLLITCRSILIKFHDKHVFISLYFKILCLIRFITVVIYTIIFNVNKLCKTPGINYCKFSPGATNNAFTVRYLNLSLYIDLH